MRRYVGPWLVLACALLLSFTAGTWMLGQETSRFDLEVVASGLEVPWDLAFGPDGTLYFTERDGRVSALRGGEVKTLATAADLSDLRVEGEAGLMGLALDPAFPDRPYIYLCYSYSEGRSDLVKVARFVLEDGALQDETTLVAGIPSATAHNGCRLAFGPDGKLYVSTGDGRREEDAQNPERLNGKILRVNPDGGIPADNPFGPDNPVWTLGHRNPQGLAFDPISGRLYSTEHGPDRDDELNLIEKGHNYGWPQVTGSENHEGFTPALKSYRPDGTIAISDLVFYQGEMFPGWQNDILFAGLKTGRLYRVSLGPDGREVAADELILTNRDYPADALLEHDYGRLRSVAVAPDGSLYLSTSNGEGRDKILRLSAD